MVRPFSLSIEGDSRQDSEQSNLSCDLGVNSVCPEPSAVAPAPQPIRGQGVARGARTKRAVFEVFDMLNFKADCEM